MYSSTPRKITRFFIINPVSDRRLEQRFESMENVVVRCDRTLKTYPAVAYEIGRRGLMLEMPLAFDRGMGIEVAFPNAPDHIRCFGHVVWLRFLEKTQTYELGISVDAWHGIIEGPDSWRKYRGVTPKQDRRFKPR